MNQDQLLQCRDFWSCEHFRRELRRSGELDFMVVTSTNAKERRFTGTSMTNFILEEEPQDDFECLRTIWDNDGDMPRFLLAVKNETVQRVCDKSGAKSRDPNPREYNPLDYVQTEHQMIPIYKSALQAYQHRATLDKQTQKAIILVIILNIIMCFA
ncbi:hypothetical protein EUX98_g7964 [Antrodiella citrinella]|uniref:Uncharacterized protein n=1 Tax=Antrodiella citrinella TaxID=2447956 RepID=A0A4S4MCJ0_9APHY|nr:hypothetical protein EUX98_g7964 [Antrodiella citrinella]